jgi:hypothetical protein
VLHALILLPALGLVETGRGGDHPENAWGNIQDKVG